MKKVEIIRTIKNLAKVNGYYARLYKAFADLYTNKPEAFALIMDKLEAENFQDATDLVLYFEC